MTWQLSCERSFPIFSLKNFHFLELKSFNKRAFLSLCCKEKDNLCSFVLMFFNHSIDMKNSFMLRVDHPKHWYLKNKIDAFLSVNIQFSENSFNLELYIIFHDRKKEDFQARRRRVNNKTTHNIQTQMWIQRTSASQNNQVEGWASNRVGKAGHSTSWIIQLRLW